MSKSKKLRLFLNSIENPNDYQKSELFNMFKEQTSTQMHYGQFHQVYKEWKLGGCTSDDQQDEQVQFEPPKQEEPEFIKTKQIGDKLDPQLLEPMKTGKLIDEVLSDEHGMLRGMVTMVIGEAGVGKSTVLGSIVADIDKKNKQVDTLYIQGEQSRVDVGYAYKKAPQTGEVSNLLLNDYQNPKSVIEKTLKLGKFDVIVIDSLADIIERVKKDNHMNATSALHWFLDLMVTVSEGDNQTGKYTSFLCIQQVTKAGDYKGSTAIKHNTTAFLRLSFDEHNPDQRYCVFDKHRRCGSKVGQRVYYYKNDHGEIKYDEKKFRQHSQVRELSNQNVDWEQEQHQEWEETFKGIQEVGDEPEQADVSG